MPYPCTDDPNEILEYVAAAKSNATKFNTFVNGATNQTVQLGVGDPTPTLRKFIADAQSVVATAANDAAETVLDTVADMKLNKADKASAATPGNIAQIVPGGNFADSGRSVGDFVLLLAYASDEALDLALLNRMNVEVYDEWYAHGIEHLEAANIDAMKTAQSIRDMIDSFDKSYAQHRLQIRLFDGTNPGAGSKPVLFVISGQSNAVGAGEYGALDQAPDCGWYWSWKDSANELKPIKDPMGDAPNSRRGSGWCQFARRFFALTGRKVIFLNLASGGAAVTPYEGQTNSNTWADVPYGELRPSRQLIWNAFSSAVPSSSYDLGAVLWIQGETDASYIYYDAITPQEYKEATLDVLSWTRTLIGDADCPVFIGKIGFNSTSLSNASLNNSYKTIQNAQDELVNSEDIFYGFSMAPYFADAWDKYMYGTIHYSYLGYYVLGNAFARSVVSYLNF